ncbi:hypothetical protein F2Q68_00027912 [Brassica cretica]|uniref:AT-hook motif nuclear-localized protein n=1 Tax=Brassica cretica TaxID=69181 RepID=A0A8S9I9Y8_BRACR|nr:hypothetical protein F2Q68_00027912 [Brassica cretica]
MQLSFTGADRTAVYKPMSSDSPPPQQQYQHHSPGGLNMNVPVTGGEQRVKKRRGRPRKYEPNSGEASLGFVPGPPSYTVSQPSGGGDGGGSGGGGGASPTVKRMRGRPSGSSNRPKLQALGSTGVGFTPHILTVSTGETVLRSNIIANKRMLKLIRLLLTEKDYVDISSKIMAFSQNGPRAVCVLSANGAISNVTLRQAATSGGTVTYEIVVGSFIPDGQKEHVGQMELASPALPRVPPSHVLTTPNSQQARGAMSESSCGGHGSHLQQSTGGPYNNNSNNLSMPWK